ncbi:MAG: sodium:solute symporter, partial [Flavobacteriaceae bacterium]|nr:sodium:solute symporter [Flavobacteriaceae bacterium]
VEASKFSYFQVVLGYILGYLVIGLVLLPLYYRLQLISIYSYLEERFGTNSYKTGAFFFILSRIVGASFRLFLVAGVLQLAVFEPLDIGVPFWLTVVITVLLIWVYTFRSGIKTIVWTDTLQTLFMLVSVGVTLYIVAGSLDLHSFKETVHYIYENEKSKIFFFDDWKSSNFFVNQFLSGAFITIVMTGLDQDMMQKNLTCRNLSDAQKNMFWFTIILVGVNLLFLSLGLLLTEYAAEQHLGVSKDDLFPFIAMSGQLGTLVPVLFILGLIAAAYSSADSALTSLTTSFSIDILNIENNYPESLQKKIRTRVHVMMSLVLILVIISFKYLIKNESVIERLFVFAGYTYGPLLGLYSFGLFTKLKIRDRWVPFICVLAPVLTYFVSLLLENTFNIRLGFFVLVLNGILTFLLLLALKLKN